MQPAPLPPEGCGISQKENDPEQPGPDPGPPPELENTDNENSYEEDERPRIFCVGSTTHITRSINMNKAQYI